MQAPGFSGGAGTFSIPSLEHRESHSWSDDLAQARDRMAALFLEEAKRVSWGAQALAAEYETSRHQAFARISQATPAHLLREFALPLIGEMSFSAGFHFGVLKYPVKLATNLVKLLLTVESTVILADLYDVIHGTLPAQSAKPVLPEALSRMEVFQLMNMALPLWSPGNSGMMLAGAIAGSLLRAGVIKDDDLWRAHDRRETFFKQLDAIMRDPVKFAEESGIAIKDEYVATWKRFWKLRADVLNPASQFEAGEIFGDMLVDLVLTILSVLSLAGGAVKTGAKLAAMAPRLMELVETLKASESAAAVGKGVRMGEVAEEVKAVPKKVPVSEAKVKIHSPSDPQSTNWNIRTGEVAPGAIKPTAGEYPNFNPGGGDTNCGACSDSVDNYLGGRGLNTAQPGPRDWPKSATNWDFSATPSQIEGNLQQAGNGARGIVYVADGPNAHVFNAINDGGKIVAIDGQMGVQGTISEVAKNAGYSGPGLRWGWSPTFPYAQYADLRRSPK